MFIILCMRSLRTTPRKSLRIYRGFCR